MSVIASCLLLAKSSHANEATPRAFSIGGPLLEYDRGDIHFSRPWKDSGKGSIPASQWAEYDFEVSADGWYGLYFEQLPNYARQVYIDGERVELSFGESPKSAAELLEIPVSSVTSEGWTKSANLNLLAGKHTMRLQRNGRMGHPSGMPRSWEIRKASDAAKDRLKAEVVGHRELRLGEPLRMSFTAGAGPASAYEVHRVNLMTDFTDVVGLVSFPESESFVSKDVEIPTELEGVYQLVVKAEGEILDTGAFPSVTYFVVDTASKNADHSDQDATQSLIAEIDCVGNTINGDPVQIGENFWEANGATNVVDSGAGEYRESGNGLGPEVNPHPVQFAENFSGFAYLVNVPNPGQPLIIEIDHPDDDWRSVCVSITDVLDPDKNVGYLPPAYAYETGGYLPLSKEMLTEKIVFWPNGKQVHIGLTSSRIGQRAGAAAIRIYEVEGQLPAQSVVASGRVNALYMEEIKRWNTHFNTPKTAPKAVQDYIGLQRTMQWCAYIGVNAFWPNATAYQEATYDSTELGGYLLQSYSSPRLSALLCEKYGMDYVAEIFLAKQRYFNQVVMTQGAEHPQDLYTVNWWGFSAGTAETPSALMPTWNILHPQVQEKLIAIYGELADQISDTSSFLGMAGRIEPWNWDGLYGLTSLNWGYEDWTMREFTKDTGIVVPGALDDPKRFETRFRYLTAPAMKERWVEWRKVRVTDFLTRLSERIREDNEDAILFLCGNAYLDSAHFPSLSDSMVERLDGMGIDAEVLADNDHIALLPTGGYGRGKSRTYLEDQESYDVFSDVDYIAIGRSGVNAFSEFGRYQEWGREFPLAKLGMPLKRWWYCSGSDAAGRNGLERLSTVLAEQDTMIIRDGGYPMLYGRRDYFSDWMADYSHLPRAPFTPVEFARDPVAVWERQEADRYLFYVVNREQYPVTLELDFKGASEVLRLSRQQTIELEDGVLRLELEPYELRSFSALAGADIVAGNTIVPEERLDFLRSRLAYAQELESKMTSSDFIDTFSLDERTAYASVLDDAWESYQDQAYWRTRTFLSSASMMAVYEKLGSYPQDQVRARFPMILMNTLSGRFEADRPFLSAVDLQPAVKSDTPAALVPSEEFNSNWKFDQVLVNSSDTLTLEIDIPVSGYYDLSVGFVGDRNCVMPVSVDGQRLAVPLTVTVANEPSKVVFPRMYLEAGAVDFTILGSGNYGLYAWILAPVLQPLPTTLWSTVGPFKSSWTPHLRGETNSNALLQGASKVYPPQADPSIDAVYQNEYGNELRWQQTDEVVGSHEFEGVNFSQRSGITALDFGFAQTFINSPKEQEVIFYLGTDWWANAYLNGEQLRPEGDLKEQQATGMWYTRWKPKPVKVTLKQGENRLLVKNQGGSMQIWFTGFMTIPGDLSFSPVPQK
ncbi:hypothetical protein SH580_03410 [Coraliomargarita algicola]|uniref:CBM6 domain-containing protein n=1 Tax=Coraliomargarita algicola TaxID=3092156 RepID=A0ABZ0RL10_9BACT|nr:hypothetical protein [Coraliomargarita sp. J2-16]WPJ96752.1 hypothetical protein SH580_03410 [Coraliomargarita sp. J2-16]